MNRKGFTLVELLVTIAVLGIITGISIPVMRSIQFKQTEKKYTTYMDALRYASKLYTDSYSVDLFGNLDSGCAYVSYADMKQYHLLKDIDISGISCDTEYTVVKIVKFNDKYYYKPYMGCGPKSNNKVNPEVFKPIKVNKADLCSNRDQVLINISVDPEKSTANNKKIVSPIVKLSTDTGVKSSPLTIEYGYSRNNDINVIGGNWTSLTFDLPSKKEQEKKIKSLTTQVFKSKNRAVSPMLTGDLYLVIKVSELKNLNDQDWKVIEEDSEKYLIFGPYRLDNEKPNYGSSRIISSVNNYKSIKPKLDFHMTDQHFSKEEELKMCYSYDTEAACPLPNNAADLNGMTQYEAYSKDKVLKEFTSGYDGSNHTIHVTVADAAGNYLTKNFSYNIARSYTLTFNPDGGSPCAAGFIKQLAGKAWKENIVIDAEDFKNHTFCSTTKTGYSYTNWYTGKKGTGVRITENSVATKNLTAYPNWKPKTVKVTFDCNGGSGGGIQTFTYGVNGQVFNKTCSKSGYRFSGWKRDKNASNREYSVNYEVPDNWINNNSPSRTLYAHWIRI